MDFGSRTFAANRADNRLSARLPRFGINDHF
jgi:hypothetical protein